MEVNSSQALQAHTCKALRYGRSEGVEHGDVEWRPFGDPPLRFPDGHPIEPTIRPQTVCPDTPPDSPSVDTGRRCRRSRACRR
jgi:hypothetical protein